MNTADFRTVTANLINVFKQYGREERYTNGQIIFIRNEEAKNLYFIQSGLIRVYLPIRTERKERCATSREIRLSEKMHLRARPCALSARIPYLTRMYTSFLQMNSFARPCKAKSLFAESCLSSCTKSHCCTAGYFMPNSRKTKKNWPVSYTHFLYPSRQYSCRTISSPPLRG